MKSSLLNRVAVVSSYLLVATLCVAHAAFGQRQSQTMTGDATLVVDGRVVSVFESVSSNREFLVQILVQKSEAIRLNDLRRSTRYPAPGENLYVHVDASEQNARSGNRVSSVLPRPNMVIRAMLHSGEHQDWVSASQEWYQEVGRDSELGVTDNSANTFGISTEQVSLRLRRALQVTRVEPGSPAAKAGLEVGDIVVEANGVDVTLPAQLADEVRKSDGVLKLTVRNVRTGRDVPVEVTSDSGMRDRSQVRALGVTTEIAFYGGSAALKVVKVTNGSPAQRAGIEPGLLILKADGSPVPKPDSLTKAERDSRGILVLQVVEPKSRTERTVRVNLR